MSLFKQQLAEALEEVNTGGDDFDKVDHPYSALKHDSLYFNAENTEFLVRILPPKDQNSFFAVGFKKMYFQVTNANAKLIQTTMILPLKANQENMLDVRIPGWVENGQMPGTYPTARPQTRYYLNVVRLNNLGNRNYEHELDENGQVKVRLMEVPKTAYEGILNDLKDDNILDPEGAGDYGAISATNAYPISLTRTGKQLDTKYHVRTYEHPLGPLPQGWENELEDLNYQATPTEDYNEEFVHYMIAVHEGREVEYNESRSQGGEQTEQDKAQADIPDTEMDHLPPKNATAQQKPMSPQAQQAVDSFQATQQPVQPASQTGFSNPAPQQPVTPPAQTGFSNPQQQASTPPAQTGFSNPQQQAATPPEQPQQNGGFSNPTPPETQAPVAPATPPAEPTPQGGGGFDNPAAQGGGIPDIDDLVAMVQAENK